MNTNLRNKTKYDKRLKNMISGILGNETEYQIR